MMKKNQKEGIIGWFVRNPVAANLLMCSIIGVGLYSGLNIRKQTTPDFDLNYVSVRVPYLGAAPEEVEEGVVIKIEEAIQEQKLINEGLLSWGKSKVKTLYNKIKSLLSKMITKITESLKSLASRGMDAVLFFLGVELASVKVTGFR